MASAFGHALVAVTFGSKFSKELFTWKLVLLGISCSILPDIDVLSFKLGISYGSLWGHRGFTHSLVFAFLLGLLVTFLFYKKQPFKYSLLLYFILSTASHSLLDAMTTGGLGVAFFSPFNTTRYFLPWRPIKVSPISVDSFFSEWGILVLKSEAIWIGIPCLILIIFSYWVRGKSKL